MAKKVLVACGGTGAHVTLAYLRLHILGYALGYFAAKDGSTLLPSLFLIDQDDGDAEGEATAWQAAKALLRRHPGDYGWDKSKNRIGTSITTRSVTPLPVGAKGDWCHRPNDHLSTRYEDSEVATMFFSQEQRQVNYSLGMMGAPALGSLLFELKKYDKDGRHELHDNEYSNLERKCDKNSRVVVTGSGVGGTGASVAPTFARKCSREGAEVMAVMIQRWFRFETDVPNLEVRAKARYRNKRMEENEVTGLAQYGQDLVKGLPTVLAGVRDGSTEVRHYTTDNQQPKSETHLHAVAALACFLQFVADEPYSEGLYCMSAEDPLRLTPGLTIPGGTLGELVTRAWALERILRSIVRILRVTYRKGRWAFEARLYTEIKGTSGHPKEVADRLSSLADTFAEQMNWVMDLVGGKQEQIERELRKAVVYKYELFSSLQARIGDKPLRGLSRKSTPKHAAQALFEWAAEWVRNHPPPFVGSQTAAAREARGNFYWPQEDGQGLSFSSTEPGQLAELPVEKAKPALDALIDGRASRVQQNGWPHPFAAVRHFEYLLTQRDFVATRKLELMILGLIAGELKLKDVAVEDDGQTPSLTGLLLNLRKQGWPGVAEKKIVTLSGQTVGFNSPFTLLCPCPDSGEAVWEQLWEKLNDSGDPEKWKSGRAEWSLRARRLRGLLQRWLNLLRKRHQSESPSWVKALRDDSISMRSVGPGSQLQVFWGEDVFTVSLPQRHDSASDVAVAQYWKRLKQEEDNKVEEEEFADVVPEFFDGLNREGVKYHVEKYVVPDGTRMRFIWHDHLSHLQEEGKVIYWLYDPENRDLWLELPGRKHARLGNFREIRLDDIQIRSCVPLDQRQIPGEEGNTEEVRYPDFPVKAEYIGLVQSDSGKNILEDYVMEGKTVPPEVYQSDAPGKGRRTWKLYLKGRSMFVRVSAVASRVSTGAHWMIWPRFRSVRRENPWSAYYLYQHATDKSLQVKAMVHHGDTVTISERPDGHQGEVHAINYDLNKRTHDGGAPVALVACRKDEEVGIYLTRLATVSDGATGWKMAVDFGTSHSVAAVHPQGRDKPEVVELLPELGFRRRRSPTNLTRHISQYWGDDGVPNADVWMPTYWEQTSNDISGRGFQGLLPTELFSKVPLNEFDSAAVLKWIPGQDYSIPVLRLRRIDISEHILSGFKWDVDQEKFRAHTKLLRKLYLAMMLEVVVAEKVMAGGEIPSKIEMTFTYPLRTSASDYKDFEGMLAGEVLPGAGDSLGTELTMFNEGLLNESEAARGGTSQFAEIVLVGDLGGGTLDLFISANDGSDVRFRTLANSVKIGGSLFLKHLANNPDDFLPPDGGWGPTPDICLSQLHAWMRSQGAVSLFGPKAYGRMDPKLGLRGFERPEEGNNVRQAIDWYFGLIVEYMARNLVGFVINEWDKKRMNKNGSFREDFPALSVKVQLRGNGWKLWYGTEIYREIERLIKNWLCWSAENALWDYRDAGVPEKESWGVPKGRNMRPKHDPTVRAVGRSLPHHEAHENGFTLPLSDLDLLVAKRREGLSWLTELPMEYSDAEMEFIQVRPSMLVGFPWGRRFRVDLLDDQTTKSINEKIRGEITISQGEIDAPIAAFIWEDCFNSKMQSRDWGEQD
ncbi:MAG: hypothetical protein OXM02_04995 [Bacteroidota bacterium]|nr:hypothetical protein [Bacteroidota bacterium]MDE2956705.1 hypothetical protein [Bacteroidota bacterium]